MPANCMSLGGFELCPTASKALVPYSRGVFRLTIWSRGSKLILARYKAPAGSHSGDESLQATCIPDVLSSTQAKSLATHTGGAFLLACVLEILISTQLGTGHQDTMEWKDTFQGRVSARCTEDLSSAQLRVSGTKGSPSREHSGSLTGHKSHRSGASSSRTTVQGCTLTSHKDIRG